MLTTRQTLILASSSPRRQELIRTLPFPVEIRTNDVDEVAHPHLSPAELVETLALRKAEAVHARERGNFPGGIVIGADTVVVLAKDVLGKPKNADDAAAMLARLQGKTHEVYSGVALIELGTNRKMISHRMTRVHMKPLTAQQIRRYVATGEPLDKAGSYAIQGVGATLIDAIEGCYFNVVGLPLSLLSDMLKKFGLQVL